MTFAEWVQTQPYGTLKRLERELGVAYVTLQAMKRGRPAHGRTAKLVSDATRPTPDQEPAVTIVELVCPAAPAAAQPTAERRGA